MTTASQPICVSANYRQAEDRRLPSYSTAERYVHSILNVVDCILVLMPPVGGAVAAVELVSRMDGFLMTGGVANVEPHPYDAPAFPPDETIDPGRDALVLSLVRACIAERVPRRMATRRACAVGRAVHRLRRGGACPRAATRGEARMRAKV